MNAKVNVLREPTEFASLREANAHRQAEWDAASQITLTYRGNELAGETGEACNVIKKIERERLGIRGSRATLRDLADELADVVICADLIAMGEGIDLLGEAVARKFNATSEKVGLSTRLADAPPPPMEDVAKLVKAVGYEISRVVYNAHHQPANWVWPRGAVEKIIADALTP